MIHEVELAGYDVKYAGDGTLTLGTWDSYGIERLHITADSDWDGLTVLATFRIGSTSVRALMDGEGMVEVPPEATSEAGSGVIVFSGTDGEMLRVSRNLRYKVLDHDPIDGEDSQPTPSEWEQLVGRVDEAKKSANESAKRAEQSADSAAGSATAADASARQAAASGAAVEADKSAAQTAAQEAKKSETEAAGSASAAAASKNSAAESASAAAVSAGEAKNSQSAASESASQAASSKTAAESSVSAAAASAEAAEFSKIAAAGSQTEASVSASAAAASAEAAESSKKAAAVSETKAETYKTAAQEAARQAQESAQLAQQISQGAMGWYATDATLREAHPTGENGQWAIVGSTDTIWTWDSDTGDWKNTSVKTDLSGYYTKEQSEKRFEMPVGYIFDWAPVEGDETDLSTAEKVAEHFGYGSWKEISGKFTFGCNEEYPAGSAGGEATHTLSLNEIPAHTHQVPIHWKSDASNYDLSYSSGKHLESAAGWTTGAAGGGQAHNNMPPYLAVYKWQRVA